MSASQADGGGSVLERTYTFRVIFKQCSRKGVGDSPDGSNGLLVFVADLILEGTPPSPETKKNKGNTSRPVQRLLLKGHVRAFDEVMQLQIQRPVLRVP